MLGEIEEDSQISNISIPDENNIIAEQNEINLGKLAKKKQSIRIPILNPCGVDNEILDIELSSTTEPLNVKLKIAQLSFHKIIVRKFSVSEFYIPIEMTDLDWGFYSFTVLVKPKSGIPIYIQVNYSLAEEGQILKNFSGQSLIPEYQYSLGRLFNQAPADGYKVHLKVNIPTPKTTFFAANDNENCKWMRVLLPEESKELYLMPSGEQLYSKTSEQDYSKLKCLFKDNRNNVVNSYIDKTIYLTSNCDVLQETPGRDPDFIIKIKKQSGNKLKLRSAPEWLKISQVDVSAKEGRFECWANSSKSPLGGMTGEVVFYSSQKEIPFLIEISEKVESLSVIDVAREAVNDYDKSEERKDLDYQILYIPMTIRGKGSVEVVIPDSYVIHSGKITNEEEDVNQQINYLIKVSKEWLVHQKEREIFITVIIHGTSGLTKSFICKFYNKKSSVVNSVKGTIGPVQLYYGIKTERKFWYELNEEEKISEYKSNIEVQNSFMEISRFDEVLNLEKVGNTFVLSCDSTSLSPGSELKAIINLNIQTNQRAFKDSILFSGTVIASDLYIKLEKNIKPDGKYYSFGRLVITNAGENSAVIRGIYALHDYTIIDLGNQNVFPFYIEAEKSFNLSYAIPKDKLSDENIIYISYNHPEQPLKVSLN